MSCYARSIASIELCARWKNIVPYSICFVSIIKLAGAFFNKANETIARNMYTVAIDTKSKPLERTT